MNLYWIPRHHIEQFCLFYGKDYTGKLLDFGCGLSPYRSCFPKAQNYIGLEYDKNLLPGKYYSDGSKYFYDGFSIPFPDNSFDIVVSFQVVEHVSDLDHSLRELKRVSRPGAMLLFTCPLMWPEHETPSDFRRFTRWGIKNFMLSAGFKVINVVPLGSIYDVIFAFLLDYINHHPSSLSPIFCKIFTPLFNLLAKTLNHLDPWALKPSRSCYLDLGVIAINPD